MKCRFLVSVNTSGRRGWVCRISGWILLLMILWIVLPIPLSAQVDTAWVRRYNGSGNEGDFAHDIAVDDSGYVYVTGGSGGPGTSYDYGTIKYDLNGDTIWVRRYNGPQNGSDEGDVIAVDNSGNVYVTGYSEGAGSGNCATIKYYANGDTAWVRRYDGPEIYGNEAFSIAVDDSGNVYVACESQGYGTSSDYATVKYYPNGDTAWVRRYDGNAHGSDIVRALAIDSLGNVYVTGESEELSGSTDCVTIKYNSNGDKAWVARYNGPGNEGDHGYAIAVDNLCNVYIAGGSQGFGTSLDCATIKYDQNGDTIWVARYNGLAEGWDYLTAIAIDNSGNVYVTGESQGLNGSADYVIIKYFTNGDTAWVRRYNGSGNGYDRAYDIAVDSAGSVYVTGGSTGFGTSLDYVTVKYDSIGNPVWCMRYNAPESSWDDARALALDDLGNVYVTGHAAGLGPYADFVTIKYIQTIGIEEDGGYGVMQNSVFTTILSGPLLLPLNRECKVFDITGRVVEPSKIPLGIYFIEIDGVVTHKVVKVR